MFLLDWYMGDQARDWFTVNQRIVTIPGNTGEYIFFNNNVFLGGGIKKWASF